MPIKRSLRRVAGHLGRTIARVAAADASPPARNRGTGCRSRRASDGPRNEPLDERCPDLARLWPQPMKCNGQVDELRSGHRSCSLDVSELDGLLPDLRRAIVALDLLGTWLNWF
jgi:hypothetical protein